MASGRILLESSRGFRGIRRNYRNERVACGNG
nr:MAG TPA: hypothetical protein [Caudoviricetes sp.]